MQMIGLNLFGVKIRLDFSFFAVLAVLLILSGSGYILWSFYACIIHELGHLIAMSGGGMRVCSVLFYGAGIKISTCGLTSFRRELVVLLSGPAVNFLTFGIFYALSGANSGLALFAVINLCIGFFNLLPLPCFDGGRVIDLVLEQKLSPERLSMARKIVKLLCGGGIIAIVIFCLLEKNTNFSLYITLLYFLILEITS